MWVFAHVLLSELAWGVFFLLTCSFTSHPLRSLSQFVIHVWFSQVGSRLGSKNLLSLRIPETFTKGQKYRNQLLKVWRALYDKFRCGLFCGVVVILDNFCFSCGQILHFASLHRAFVHILSYVSPGKKGENDIYSSLSPLQYNALLCLPSFFKYRMIPSLGVVAVWKFWLSWNFDWLKKMKSFY